MNRVERDRKSPARQSTPRPAHTPARDASMLETNLPDGSEQPQESMPVETNGHGHNGAHAGNALPHMTRTAAARIPTAEGEFYLYHYTNSVDDKEHLALVMGDVTNEEVVLARVHSECFTGDVLGSRRCDCGEQLHHAMARIAEAGRGVIIYLRQEGRGIGLSAKLQAYNLQDAGYDTVEANLLLGHQADEREYWAAAAILSDLQVRSINLLTNNPAKIEHLKALDVSVVGRTPVVTEINDDNRAYMATKVQRMRHMLNLPATPQLALATAALDFGADINLQLQALQQRIAHHTSNAARPFVTLTYAQSLDGSIAGPGNAPLRLSGEASMRLTHHLRAMHDGILVGIGTVLSDDPQLTVRLPAATLQNGSAPAQDAQPQPIVLDSRLRFPEGARLLNHPRGVWLATDPALVSGARMPDNATLLPVPLRADGHRELDLQALLAALHARGVHSLMVEGGARVIASFLRAQLVDALIITIAPRLVAGVGALAAREASLHSQLAPASATDASAVPPQLPRLQAARYTPIGEDVLLWSIPNWH